MHGTGTNAVPKFAGHYQSQTPVIWDMDEITKLQYRWEPFNDTKTLDAWARTYQNKTFSVGMKCDYQCVQPSCQQAIFDNIRKNLCDLTHPGFIWFRMRPGDLLPNHADTYVNYRKRYNVDLDQIFRVLVFLQDWQPGFLFEVNGTAINHYTAGTFVVWQGATHHMAGNLGNLDRYTLQITTACI